MLNCKKLCYLFTVLFIIGFTGSAYAAFEMTASTDVKIMTSATCNQAGSYTMSAADGLKIREGDVITFSLTNNVFVCDALDYFLLLCDDGTVRVTNDTSYAVYTNDATSTEDSGDEFTITDAADGSTLTYTTLLGDGSDWAFGLHISSAVNTGTITATAQRCNITTGALGTSTLNQPTLETWMFEFDASGGTSADSKMYVSLFDEKNTALDTSSGNVEGLAGYLQKGTVSSNTTEYGLLYTSQLAAEDNALCIDTVTGTPTFVDSEYVEATPSSNPTVDATKLNFTGTYRIAKVSGSSSMTIAAVGKGSCPEVSLYATKDQDGNTIAALTSFEAGTYDTSSSCSDDSRWKGLSANVCQETDKGRGIIITNDSTFATNSKYAVSMTLVKKASGSDSYGSTSHAWWYTGTTASYFTSSANAANTSCTSGTATAVVTASGSWTGLTTSSFTVVPPDGSTSYTGYHTWATGAAGNTWIDVGSTYTAYNSIMVDMQPVFIDYNNLAVGDTIGVTVSVSKYPCGVLKSETICIGEVVSTECPTFGSACNMTYSYLINPANTAYWSGLALSNLGSLAGTATMTFTDSAGGTATVSQAMAANAIEVMLFNESWATGLSSSTLDTSKNMRLYITTDFACEGQLIIGGSDPTSGIYGYPSRNSCFSSAP